MSAAALSARTAEGPSAATVSRKIFSFPVVLASFLIVLAVLTVRGRFDDPDMWWHLKNGEVIWTTHAIPMADHYSYTTHQQKSIPQEWLSETLIYGAYKAGGYSGLMAWLCFFSAALLIAGYTLCSFYSGNAKIGFLGAMVLWFFSTVGLAIRGQIIGYLLLAIELLLLHLGRTRNPRWFYCLPLLFLIWVNCHASFFFGLVVLGVFLFCSYFDFKAGSLVSIGWTATLRRHFLIAIGLSAVSVFVNPAGVRQVMYPLNTLLRQHIVVTQIDEWKPLALRDPRGVGLLAILALIALFLFVRRSEKLFLEEVLLLAMGAWLALSHRRMVFVFGVLAAPVVSRLLARSWDGYDASTDRRLPNAVFIALAVTAVFLAFPSRLNLANQVDEGSPAKAVEYIKTNRLSGNMLNTFGDGGYLIWTLPEHPVFVDGRADVFEWTGVLGEFGRWATLQSEPNALLEKYHVGFCLLERDAPMARVLPLMRNWKEVYSDDASVIFVRTGPEPALNQ
ncbi:MAG TPA: hypothetical protein VFW25_07520 [Silvibacterium sp.]|nr:hypothetical protein [Silvibacterium sp.]